MKHLIDKFSLDPKFYSDSNKKAAITEGVFAEYGFCGTSQIRVLKKTVGSPDEVLAILHTHDYRFIELQFLLYDIRQRGVERDIRLEKDELSKAEYYLSFLELLLKPITEISEFYKVLEKADKLVPHFSSRSYLELISLDGSRTLSGEFYNGSNFVVSSDNKIQVFYRERSEKTLKIEFFNNAYLYEYLINSVAFIT
jgi:hypothetical protein